MTDIASLDASRTTTMIGRLVGPAAGPNALDHARAVVLDWAFKKFPDLAAEVGSRDQDLCLEREGISLESFVDCEGGESSWRFQLRHPEPRQSRVWQTEVRVATGEGLCTLMVRNSYFGGVDTPQFTQPRFYTPLVKEFQWIDAGVEVSDTPLPAQRRDQYEGFKRHLTSEYRAMPMIVLAPHLKESEFRVPFACNPMALAKAMCGLAHVVMLSRISADALVQEFGDVFEVPPGSTRVFYPVSEVGHQDRQSLFVEQQPLLQGSLIRACYSWSASPARAREFEWLGG